MYTSDVIEREKEMHKCTQMHRCVINLLKTKYTIGVFAEEKKGLWKMYSQTRSVVLCTTNEKQKTRKRENDKTKNVFYRYVRRQSGCILHMNLPKTDV